MTCRCKPTFSGATFEWDALYYPLPHTAILQYNLSCL
jgi:hypothetical protein